MDLSLRGKIALVGGASQGIGYAIARMLAAEGACVAMVARREDALVKAAEQVKSETGCDTLAIPADIRKEEDCGRIITETLERFGRIDILVNNDGAPPLGMLDSFSDADWVKAIEQNLMSVVRLSRGVLPSMQAGGGRIVNIAALSVLQPMPRFGLSVATWSAVLGFAKTLSLEVAAKNITVNTICPGRIATQRLAAVFGTGRHGDVDEKLEADLIKDIPMRRLGTPDEIAGLVAFLASAYAAYMTGCVFHADGGRRASLL